MSIQTTQEITRNLAERLWVDMMLDNIREEYVEASKVLSDELLENHLESEFTNYSIFSVGDYHNETI